MKTLLATFVVILTAISPASARLGETSEQCQKRYGIPKHVDEEHHISTFEKAGVTVRCSFYEDVCVQIVFSPADGKPAPHWLTDGEVAALLEANGGGQNWNKTSGSSDGQGAWSTLTRLNANYDQFNLTITDLKKLEEKQLHDAKVKLKGF